MFLSTGVISERLAARAHGMLGGARGRGARGEERELRGRGGEGTKEAAIHSD